jgi:hypothetical protein
MECKNCNSKWEQGQVKNELTECPFCKASLIADNEAEQLDFGLDLDSDTFLPDWMQGLDEAELDELLNRSDIDMDEEVRNFEKTMREESANQTITERLSMRWELPPNAKAGDTWAAAVEAIRNDEKKPSQRIVFGYYSWIVLDVQSDKALLLSDRIIELRPFDEPMFLAGEGISKWEHSQLREFLNGEFLRSFSNNDLGKIMSARNVNPSNELFGTAAESDTNDLVFLLSVADVFKYFGGEQLQKNLEDLKCEIAKLEKLAMKDPLQALRLKTQDDLYTLEGLYEPSSQAFYDIEFLCFAPYSNPGWWWLRTVGEDDSKAAFINYLGQISWRGREKEKVGGVRPALWLKL